MINSSLNLINLVIYAYCGRSAIRLFFSQKQMLVFIAICGQCKVQVCTLIPEYYLPRV